MTQVPLSIALLVLLCAPFAYGQAADTEKELQLGIAAYERFAYREAAEHFIKAVALNPASARSHLYLANAYNDAYCEDCETDSDAAAKENEQWSSLAIAEYKKVLDLAPANTEALLALAHRYFWKADYDEAERCYRRVISINANDAEALYTLAVIDFTRSYRVRIEEQAALKLSRRQSLIGSPGCGKVRSQNLESVEEGISLLKEMLPIRNATDAMGYMAALYQEKAEIDCGDRPAYRKDMNTFRQWARRECEMWQRPDAAKTPPRWPAALPPPPSIKACSPRTRGGQ